MDSSIPIMHEMVALQLVENECIAHAMKMLDSELSYIHADMAERVDVEMAILRLISAVVIHMPVPREP